MAENTEQNHPWNNLLTITTFDTGSNAKSNMQLRDTSKNQHNSQVIQRVKIPAPVLVEALIHQICYLFEEDRTRRQKLYTAICQALRKVYLFDDCYNMTEFESLRQHYSSALYHLISTARAATGSENVQQIPNHLTFSSSRYFKEFHEIGHIASGGFGEVFKALNRLDGIEYAIKKMRSSCLKSMLEYVNEVKTLAKLNHSNIVSYKTAWIEAMWPPSVSSKPSMCNEICNPYTPEYSNKCVSCCYESEISHSHISNYSLDSSNIYNDTFGSRTTDASGYRITKESNIEEYIEEASSDVVSFRYSKDSENFDQTENDASYTDSYCCKCKRPINKEESCTYVSRQQQEYMTLYIQMALCEETLQQWMNRRINETPQAMVIAIFEQLVRGINYIHSQNIVHHDIKSSNIFISTSGQLRIQLGDFGLACPLQKQKHHNVVGTFLYAAPEQVLGKCNKKSDIYSAGIVLTELLIPVKTRMEFTSILDSLKRGNIPEAFPIERHKWAHLIIQLVQKDPTKRPSTEEILQDLNKDKDMLIAELKKDVSVKDNTIQKLQEKISLLEMELKKLN